MDICLVSMPYAAIERPSIALGLMTAELRRAGMQTESVYANLAFASRIGFPAYDVVMKSSTGLLVGEWTFAASAFPERAGVDPAWLADATHDIVIVPEMRRLGDVDPQQFILDVRGEASSFVEELAGEIVARRPRIVGCSSIFQQHTASLALLRAIRARDPEIITIIGGANCETTMGMAAMRAFPWLDFVFSGEADEVIVPFCRALLARGRSVESLPAGVIDRAIAHDRNREPPRASVWSLDPIPTPDYDDYFSALERSPLAGSVTPAVVVETSRGCWWGAKSHCTFCGLNGTSMTYRAKSADRALEEFDTLYARYGVRRFTVVDNIIDLQYHEQLLPKLAGRGYDIFYETKANVRRHHMQSFFDAGVRSIQPGMENMHDDILRLLAKGNTGWMNVQLLKWARELSMEINWVFLVDVPGQRDDWYLQMLTWLPLIAHLRPPDGATPIHYHRFSPYHRDPDAWGLDLTPEPAYSVIYPLDDAELREFAYYFIDRTPRPPQIGQRLLVSWLRVWKSQYPEAALEMRWDGDAIEIRDTRPCRTAEHHRLAGITAVVYAECDAAVDRRTLLGQVRQVEPAMDAGYLDAIVARLREEKLLLELGGRLLALAVDGTRERPAYEPNPSGSVNHQNAF